jgi:Ulp1 family protease
VACSEEIPKLELPTPWKQPLLYPFEGSKRANVDYEDLVRLSPTEFLNDNIINFYLRSSLNGSLSFGG